MTSGIAPALLVSQVKNTAAWLWDRPSPAVRFLEGGSYFEILLAAHWSTVATFVPTDVAVRGKVRDVLDVGPEHFATRIDRKLKAARG